MAAGAHSLHGTTRVSGRRRLEAVIRGTVQGVGFRWFVTRQAARLALVGWVANDADGSVRVVAEGQDESLDRLEAALRQGPAGARVSDVTATRTAATNGFSRFEVRASGHRGD